MGEHRLLTVIKLIVGSLFLVAGVLGLVLTLAGTQHQGSYEAVPSATTHNEASERGPEALVWVVEGGDYYHRQECPQAATGARPMSAAAAQAARHRPCSACRP